MQRKAIRRDLAKDFLRLVYRRAGLQDDYERWLVRNLGRPMFRALLKAKARYEAQQPARIRAKALNRAYRAKKR